jgi:hypothetical protein
MRIPDGAFGYVPTPALVAPIEFTLSFADYAALGGYVDRVRDIEALKQDRARKRLAPGDSNPWPLGHS